MDKRFLCEVCNSTVYDAVKNQQGFPVCPICGSSADNLRALKPIGKNGKRQTKSQRGVKHGD